MAKNQKKPSKSLLPADPILLSDKLSSGVGNVNQIYETANISSPPSVSNIDAYREKVKNWKIPLRIPTLEAEVESTAPTPPTPEHEKARWISEAYKPNDRSRPLEEKRMEYAKRIEPILRREGITDPKALINIMANVQHESTYDNTSRENLGYTVPGLLKTFPKKFPNTAAGRADAERTVKGGRLAIANRLYGKKDAPELDALIFRGRGSLMLTKKGNFETYGNLLSKKLGRKIDLVADPELLNRDPNIDAELVVQYFLSRVGKDKLGDIKAVTKAVGAATDPKPRYDTARQLEQWYQQEYLPSSVKPKSPPASTPVPKYKEANQRAQDAMFEELLGGGR